MDRRFLTVLAVSLLFALLVSGIFYQLSRGSGGAKAAALHTKELVMAARALSIGATVQPEDLKIAKIPVDTFPKGGFSKIEEVTERPVISNILVDEPILEGRLGIKGGGFGLAPVIPPGMRAATLRVTDVVGVAGFVQPGLRVDVLVTGRPPNHEENVTTTVLQNIQVLGAGTTLVPDSRGQAINAHTVTVLVTPEQAEILTLATNEGKIQLVLRNSKDNGVEKTPGTDGVKLFGRGSLVREARSEVEDPDARLRRARPAPVAAIAAVPVPKTEEVDQIVMIRGTTRTVEKVMKFSEPETNP